MYIFMITSMGMDTDTDTDTDRGGDRNTDRDTDGVRDKDTDTDRDMDRGRDKDTDRGKRQGPGRRHGATGTSHKNDKIHLEDRSLRMNTERGVCTDITWYKYKNIKAQLITARSKNTLTSFRFLLKFRCSLSPRIALCKVITVVMHCSC
jgi:hypothetical protein